MDDTAAETDKMQEAPKPVKGKLPGRGVPPRTSELAEGFSKAALERRKRHVEELKKLVRSGSYQIDAEKTAQALVGYFTN